MVKQIVDTTKEEDEIVNELARKWKLSKTDAIKKLIRDAKKVLADDFEFDMEDIL
jgi:hypothetical protein